MVTYYCTLLVQDNQLPGDRCDIVSSSIRLLPPLGKKGAGSSPTMPWSSEFAPKTSGRNEKHMGKADQSPRDRQSRTRSSQGNEHPSTPSPKANGDVSFIVVSVPKVNAVLRVEALDPGTTKHIGFNDSGVTR